MKKHAWIPVALWALSQAQSATAQTTSPWQPLPGSKDSIQQTSFGLRPRGPQLGGPCPCPTPMPPSTLPEVKDPTKPPPKDTTTPTPTSPEEALSGAGQFKSTAGHTNSVFAGTGVGSAISGDPVATTILTPLVMPGMFTVGTAQSAIPIDRIYFDYGFYNGVRVAGVGSSAPVLTRTFTVIAPPPPNTGGGGSGGSGGPLARAAQPQPTTIVHSSVSQSSDMVPAFNLNQFNLGIEKTFWNGMWSAYLNVPLLYATDNITGQQINGIGDISAGFKTIFRQDAAGNTLTGGLTIAFPTAHPAVSNSVQQTQNGVGGQLLPSTSVSVNPTFFQPWAAGLLVFDRAFIHEYFGLIIPSDDRVATFINNDITIGYQLYRSPRDQFITSITPTFATQIVVPVNHVGTPGGQGVTAFVPFNANGSLPAPAAPGSFIFSTQVFLAGGVQVGLNNRWLFSANAVVPVASPRGYPVGAVFGLNYFY